MSHFNIDPSGAQKKKEKKKKKLNTLYKEKFALSKIELSSKINPP
jgi:hypothetical protein